MKMSPITFLIIKYKMLTYSVVAKWQSASADPEGGTRGPDPLGKSQVIWVSIGNKQLDPPTPGKCWNPWKMLDPSGTLKIIVSLKLTI